MNCARHAPGLRSAQRVAIAFKKLYFEGNIALPHNDTVTFNLQQPNAAIGGKAMLLPVQINKTDTTYKMTTEKGNVCNRKHNAVPFPGTLCP